MTGKDPHIIGARIARRRHQLGWSQVELAQRLGVSSSSVANWERGAAYPKKKLGKVEQVLGIVLDDPADRSPPPEGLSEETKAMMREELGPEMAARLIAHAQRLATGQAQEAGDDPVPGSAGRGRRPA